MDELIKRGAVRLMLKGLANGVLSGEAKALKTNDIKSLYQIRGAKEILKTADDYLDDIPTVDAQPVDTKGILRHLDSLMICVGNAYNTSHYLLQSDMEFIEKQEKIIKRLLSNKPTKG